MTEERKPGEIGKVLADASASPSLTRLRHRSGVRMAAKLCRTGLILQVRGHIFGTGRIDGTSPRGNGDDEIVAVGALLQIAGELTKPAVQLLSKGEHYAGAALVRQVVEVEYLMWAFASNPGEARMWVNSTREQRMKFFQPARLRRRSNGRFRDVDYAHHCEMGGHPVPRSLTLIGRADNRTVQLLIVDVLLHGWRITNSAIEWSAKKDLLDGVRTELESVRAMLARWSKADPLRKLTERPAPPTWP